ncbi:MAG: hypothetical protein R2857_15890 [Vampirovibrionales bacterium]
MGPILFIGILNDVGDVMAARSPHERREVFLKRLPVTVTFFFGDLIWLGWWPRPSVVSGLACP